LKVVSLFIN
jgi:hypothetical protein